MTNKEREQQRYAAVQAQMKELLDAAAADLNPATNLLRAMLYAELYAGNEATHERIMKSEETDADSRQ